MINIVWFKRDLRVDNHAALNNALNKGPIIALYCWEPTIWQAEDASIAQQSFVGECLRSLRKALSIHDIPLHISALGIIETLNFITQSHTIHEIHSHEETGNLPSYRVDQSVAKWCKINQVTWHEYLQHGVIRRLKNRDNWHRQWETHMQSPCQSLPSTRHNHPMISLPKLAVTRARGQDKQQRQKGGREAGLTILNSFLSHRSRFYKGGISSPITATEACSRLSPYLATGCLSMQEVVQQSRLMIQKNKAKGLSPKDPKIAGLNRFESRLHWHCHFIQKLESEPTLEIKHMHTAHAGMRDEMLNDLESKKRLTAWCKGETGWPLVDACLAMLREKGWVNFRMRAMLISTASYLLWLHWRETGLHLAREFIDYEPGIHWPQVQMQSGSTGINTLRIYNPIKQAQDQDPRGQFVRQWIPALRRVPDAWIFQPQLMPASLQLQYGCILEKDYPMPLTDIKHAMHYAKSQIAMARKNNLNQQETSGVVRKHASRLRQSKKSNTKKQKQSKTNDSPPQQNLF